MEESTDYCSPKETGWRSTFSIIVGVGWLIFIIAWLAFFASNIPSWEQNFAIFLLSILVLFTLLGGVWAALGMKRIPKEGKEMFKMFGFKWRIQSSIVIPFISMVFLIVWFWFYAAPFTIWQNIAVILITILAVGGILGSIWTRWGMKNAWKFDKQKQTSYYHHEHIKKDNKEDEKEDD